MNAESYWSGKQAKNKKKKYAFSFPKETREGKSLWVYLTPSLVYIRHVGIEFYMNDEIIQIKLIVVIKGSHKT